jgi:hypothetical protein
VNYDAFRDMAVRLLRTNGRQLLFKRVTPGAFNTAAGRPGAPVIITALAYAVVLPFQSARVQGNRLADQLQIREGEQLVLVAGAQMTVTGASTWAPIAGDQLVTTLPDGGSWKVARSITIDPDASGSILHAVVIAK